MSTKTVLKRVALVAVAALAIGGVSAVSANAVANPNVNISTGYPGFGGPTGSTVAGPANSMSITQTNANGTYVTITGGTFAGGLTSATLIGGSSSILIPTPSVGTITVSGYGATAPGLYSPTVTDTVTITVLAAPAGTVYNHSTAFIGAPTNGPVVDTLADVAESASQAASSTALAQITVAQYSSTDSSTPLNDANTNAVVVSIAGAGLVGTHFNGDNRGPAAATSAGAAHSGIAIGSQTFYVFPSGQAGTGTITVSVNGAVVATKTVTLTGTFAAYTTGSTQSAPLGVGVTQAITYTGVDANKNVAAVSNFTAVTSSNTAVATVTGIGTAILSVTGVAPGTATITGTNGTVTTTLTYTVTKTTAKTVTMAFDKSSYAPGEKMTLTVSAVDSNGAPVADGVKALFAGVPTSNVLLQGTYPAASPILSGGSATYTLYAPFAAGNVVVTGTEGGATDNVIAAGTPASITASATVVADTSALDAANAAADAAAEATDAANAATDAANAAADAADSATSAAQDAADQAGQALAAVNTLATSVASLIAGIKAQLTSLTNLVVKLQASVAVLPKK